MGAYRLCDQFCGIILWQSRVQQWEIRQEFVIIIWKRDDGGLDQSNSSGGGENLCVFLNKVLMGFVDGLDMRCKRKRKVKSDFKVLGLRN